MSAQGSAGAHWPDGVRLPISISMMWEAGSEPMPMLPPQVTPQEAGGKRFPNLSAYTEEQYGWREGIPRMLDMFDRRGIKVSSFLSSKGLEHAPKLAREIADRGHECAAHGITHTPQFHLSREDELKFIVDGVALQERLTGQHPVGYNCQGVWRSTNTLSLLQELGFLYHIDDFGRDEPYIVPVDGKPFVVMPYTRYLNDLIHYQLQQGDLAGYERSLNEEFAALYEEAASRRRMMVISLHDKLARPARIKIVEDFIKRVQQQQGVWFARKDELARFVLDSPTTIRETEAT